ncbi:hypothetical protein M2352_003177 [Azospirillum fermentarium]|uniref:hypothetical protein n=1 Tax=Azospirillum fermentarium TaxID=1233114 RepID=UPI0022265FE4|nr:hypothetical protein [Azospirillum fermentarium]MCW2247543.1 hypothetical protein [Azospirillum fermentarium]
MPVQRVPAATAPHHVPHRTAVEMLLDDPIVDLLLQRDGLTRSDVLAVMDTARRNLKRAARLAA